MQMAASKEAKSDLADIRSKANPYLPHIVLAKLRGSIMSLAALTQTDIVEIVEATALLSPISYLEHKNAPFALRMVNMHLDKGLFGKIKISSFSLGSGQKMVSSSAGFDKDCSGVIDANGL